MATKVRKEAISPDGSMTLMGHLKEFRNRLIICAAVFLVTCAIALGFAGNLVSALADLGLRYNYTFVTLSPQEQLIQYFKIALLAALVVSVPVIMYHIWAFAKPGLKKKETTFFGMVMFLGVVLFCIGVAFAYFVTLPFMLNFLITLEGASFITNQTSLESYLNFIVMIFTIFGCVFEMPLVTVILSKMGIANPTIMRKGRSIALIIMFLIAALITPPDIVSQMMVGFPMVLLYEISILLSQLTYRKKTDDDEDDDDLFEDEDEEDDED
ncbi:MAG: twin-arginine translocase subunit TatC [Faecalibacterium sp.]